MLTRWSATNPERFAEEVELAFAKAPELADPDAPKDDDLYIALVVEIDGNRHGVVASIPGVTKFDTSVQSFLITEFWKALCIEGHIGGQNEIDRAKLAKAITVTGNPLDDLIRIAGGLHQKELEREREKQS